MGHMRSSKDNLLKRVKRIAGQIQAIERALDSDDDCSKTLLLVASTRGAINGLMDEIIEDHAREHVANPTLSNEERAKGVDVRISEHRDRPFRLIVTAHFANA